MCKFGPLRALSKWENGLDWIYSKSFIYKAYQEGLFVVDFLNAMWFKL